MVAVASVQTIPAVLRSAAERFGDRTAIIDGAVCLTYRELLEHVRMVARVYLAGGVRRGDRIAVNSPNTHH
ncbi:hypothetical protein ACZ91_37250, partial [Streptomyces regensis]